MTKFKEWNLDTDSVDLLVGGTPCQSFSVAGLRKGLDDSRGNLALSFISMVDYFKPEWVIWENVPGVLSSSGGRDFGSFIGALASIGYGFAYRVLDAQYFGVPQRRRRVFVVAHSSGDSRRAAEVLFEPESLQWDNKKSRTQRKKSTESTITGTVSTKCAKGTGGPAGDECYNLVPVLYQSNQTDARLKEEPNTSQTVLARWGTGGGNTPMVVHPAHAFKIRGGCEGGGKGYLGQDEKAYTVSTTQDQHLMQSMAVRRLTPVECERLQGLPDGWTDIKPNGKETPDGSRYKAIGNSMAVPVMRWIGERINRARD